MGLTLSTDLTANRPPNNFVGGLLRGTLAAVPLPPMEAVPAPPVALPAPKKMEMKNPGSIGDLHQKTRDVFPAPFNGANFSLSQIVREDLLVTHRFALGKNLPKSYSLGATWAGATQPDATGDVYPVLNVDIGSNGNYYFNGFNKFGERTTAKFQVQGLAKELEMVQIALDFKTDKSTLTCAVVDPDLRNRQGTFLVQYLQNITPRLALGAELTVHRLRQIPGGQAALLALSGKYKGTDCVISGSISRVFMNLCYYQKSSDQLRFGVEMSANLVSRKAVGTFGYRVDLPSTDFQFRGSIDSNWNVSGVVQKKLEPAPYTLTLSGALNLVKNTFSLGLGFHME